MIGGLIAALVIALFITAITALIFRKKGPWGTTWTFFLLLFLTLWAVSIYVRGVGPVYWGIAWLPLIIAGIILAVVLASVIPNANQLRDEVFTDSATSAARTPKKIREGSARRKANWFWIMIVILILAIMVGMVNPQMAL
jgi:hypothetical protein